MEKPIDKNKCFRCKGELVFKETPEFMHYGKIVCSKCDFFVKWMSNPENEDVRTKTSRHTLQQVLQFHKKEKGLCFFCLRTKEQLGECEGLTRDHIEEINDGGKDELENLQVLCTACHKLKNWMRLYMNWHFNKKKE